MHITMHSYCLEGGKKLVTHPVLHKSKKCITIGTKCNPSFFLTTGELIGVAYLRRQSEEDMMPQEVKEVVMGSKSSPPHAKSSETADFTFDDEEGPDTPDDVERLVWHTRC